MRGNEENNYIGLLNPFTLESIILLLDNKGKVLNGIMNDSEDNSLWILTKENKHKEVRRELNSLYRQRELTNIELMRIDENIQTRETWIQEKIFQEKIINKKEFYSQLNYNYNFYFPKVERRM